MNYILTACLLLLAVRSLSADTVTVPPSLNNKVRQQLLEPSKQNQTIVFVTTWCPVCKALEAALKSSGAEYTILDIESNTRAEKLYFELGRIDKGDGIPLSLVGDQLIRGFDPRIIAKSKLNSEKRESKPNENSQQI